MTEESIGMEAAGQSALFKGDFKLVRNGRPYGVMVFGDYISGETIDLKESQPQKNAARFIRSQVILVWIYLRKRFKKTKKIINLDL